MTEMPLPRVVHRFESPHLLPAGLRVRDSLARFFNSLGEDLFTSDLGSMCASRDLEFPITIEIERAAP